MFAGEGSAIIVATTGTVNAVDMEVAYDNSNAAGVLGGIAAADQTAASNVTTGVEISIALSDIGNPSNSFTVCAFVGGQNRDGLSNQVLGGLPAPQANLASDGLGNWLGSISGLDFNTFAGDQFFTVIVPEPDGPYDITNIQLINGNTEVVLNMNGLVIGKNYKIHDSVDLASGFSEVAGSLFTATSDTAHLEVIPAGPATDRFFQVVVP